MRRIFIFAAFAAVLLMSAGTLFAQRGSAGSQNIEVRLASPLPRQSPWGQSLDRIAAEWNRITNGQVTLRVLHGGTEGGEGKMILSLAADQIQAAVFTTFGLSDIYSGIMTLSAPFLIRNTAELNAVMNEVQSDLEARLNAGDYFMLAWSKPGFVNIFSSTPVHTPDDLRRLSLASNNEAQNINTALKTMGFRVVETDWTDIGPKINAGTINAIYQVPTATAALQVQNYLKNMLSINLAPTLGGIIIKQSTWRRIGELNPNYQRSLMDITRRIGAELDNSMQTTESNAIATMRRGGLVVNTPTAAQEQLWYAEAERAVPALLANNTYDPALYQRINDILTRYRAGRR